MSQKPTVGRIVHYYVTDKDEVPLAAIVTFVSTVESTDGVPLVNLVVFDRDGGAFFPQGVAFSEAPQNRTWRWPPRS